MNKQQQMQDLLKDTVGYYSKDPANRRSVDKDGNCMYTWGNQHCAVGRYLKPEYQVENWINNNESVNQLCEDSPKGWDIDWCLRDDVQGLDPDFWRNLQDFHDSRHNWVITKPSEREVGISDEGKCEYATIQNKIAEGRYDG